MQTSMFIGILCIHYLADFICQPRKWAETKHNSLASLTKHVLLYSSILFISTWIMFFDLRTALWFTVANGFLHFVTDFLTSKLSHIAYEKKDYYAFWNIIGMDQLLHTVTLLVTVNACF